MLAVDCVVSTVICWLCCVHCDVLSVMCCLCCVYCVVSIVMCWLCCVQSCVYLGLGEELRVNQPEVTLWGWWDITMWKLT